MHEQYTLYITTFNMWQIDGCISKIETWFTFLVIFKILFYVFFLNTKDLLTQ
jgi:hypothetical protein